MDIGILALSATTLIMGFLLGVWMERLRFHDLLAYYRARIQAQEHDIAETRKEAELRILETKRLKADLAHCMGLEVITKKGIVEPEQPYWEFEDRRTEPGC